MLARKGDAHQTGYSFGHAFGCWPFSFRPCDSRAYMEHDMLTFDEYIAEAPRYVPPADFDAWLATAERVGG